MLEFKYVRRKYISNLIFSIGQLHDDDIWRVSMGLTDRRKTAKNLVDSRKNWKILTVSRKWSKKN